MSDSMLDTGLHQITADEYFALPAVSRSTLWQMRRSPTHCYEYMMNPPLSAAFDMGSAIHTAVLEPHDLDDNFAARPAGIDARTKAGKAALAAWKEESEGKILLPGPDAMETLRGCSNAVLTHPLARQLVGGEGLTEITATWTDPGTGLACKARADRVVKLDNIFAVVDLKTTMEADPRAVGRTVLKYGYHFQGAMYLEAMNRAVGEADRAFVLVLVEKAPPYGVAVYELDFSYLEAGRRLFREYLTRYAECMEAGIWPGYPTDIQLLEAPGWVT